jgi:hypothetical protein
MNVPTVIPHTPAMMGGWFTDAGSYLGKAGRSFADIWGTMTSPNIVPTFEEDNTMMYVGAAGVIGLVAVVLLAKKKKKARR